MYCPTCFNNTLSLSTNGVINIMINQKKRDTGRILFNTERERKEEIQANVIAMSKDYFKWYSGFNNVDPTSKLFIYSSDFSCENKCAIPIESAISVIGQLFNVNEGVKLFRDLGEEYDLDIEVQGEEV